MRPDDLKKMLEQYGLRPIHGRGQNFLLDDSVVVKMTEAAGVGPGSRILEIGPGPGILTAALLAAGAHVTAVEIDSRFFRFLQKRFGGQPGLDLIEGDVLDMPNQDIAERLAGDWQVVSNLPYGITSAVLEKFLFHEPRPKSLTLMLQREVADRILAKPRDMSSLAVACQSLGEPRRVVNVPRGSFFPPPEVDSAVIHIRLKNEAERREFFQGVPESDFFRIVRQAFVQKRKQIKNSLRSLPGTPEQQEKTLQQAKIPPSARPEELTPEQWLALAMAIIGMTAP